MNASFSRSRYSIFLTIFSLFCAVHAQEKSSAAGTMPVRHVIPLPAALAQSLGIQPPQIEYEGEKLDTGMPGQVVGKIVQPTTIKPFGRLPGAPADLRNLTLTDLEVSIKQTVKSGGTVQLDNIQLYGLTEINKKQVAMRLDFRRTATQYDYAVTISIPPKRPGVAKELLQPWTLQELVPVLSKTALGKIACKQMSIIITSYDFTTTTGLAVGPYFNIEADFGNQKLSQLSPYLANTLLGELTLENARVTMLKLKSFAQLQTGDPTITFDGTMNIEGAGLTKMPFNVKGLKASVTVTSNSTKLKAQVGEEVSLGHLGTLTNVDIVASGSMAPSSLSFGISGQMKLVSLNATVNAYLGLPQTSTTQKSRSLKDFVLVATMPPSFDLKGFIAKLPAAGTGQLSAVLGKLKQPTVVLVQAPTAMSSAELQAMLNNVTISAEEKKAFNSLGAVQQGISLIATVDELAAADLVPKSLQSNAQLQSVTLKEPLLIVRNLASLENLAQQKPEVLFTARADLSQLPLISFKGISMSDVPVTVQYQDKVLLVESKPEQSIELPGLSSVGMIKSPQLVVRADGNEKTVSVLLEGSASVSLPRLNQSIDFDIAAQFEPSGLTVNGKSDKRTPLTPFAQMSAMPQAVRGLSFSDVELDAKAQYTSPVRAGAVPVVKTASVVLRGKVSSKSIGLSGEAELEVIKNDKGKTGSLLRIYPKELSLSKLAPRLSDSLISNLDLKNSGLLISTMTYKEPKIDMVLQPYTLTLYGSTDAITVGELFPKLSSRRVADIKMKDVSYLVGNIGGNQVPSFSLKGTFDFGTLKIPGVDEPLNKLYGEIVYNKKGGLRLIAKWQKQKPTVIKTTLADITLEDPEIEFKATPKKGKRGKFKYSYKFKAPGKVKLDPVAKLPEMPVSMEVNLLDKTLVRKYYLDKDIKYWGILLKRPYLTMMTGNKIGFQLHGESVYDDMPVRSTFTFLKTRRNPGTIGRISGTRKGDIYIEYIGEFYKASLKPFEKIANLAGVRNTLAENPYTRDLGDVEIKNPRLGIHVGKNSQAFFVYGDVTLYGIPTETAFYVVRNYLGKKGVVLLSVVKDYGKTMGDLTQKLAPKPALEVFDRLPKNIQDLWNSLEAPLLGFALSNVQYTFHIDTKQGISPYPTADSVPYELNAGASILGMWNVSGELEEKIDELFYDVEPRAMFIASMGLSFKAWLISIFLDDARWRYNLGSNYTVAPGPFIVEASLEPSVAADVGVTVKTPDDQELVFIGSAAISTTEPPLVELNTALTMEGIWKQPFGFKYMSFGEVAGSISWDVTSQIAKVTAGGAAGTAVDPETGGAGTAAGATVGETSSPVPVTGGGFTYSVEVGEENDPLKIDGDIAIDVEGENLSQLLAFGRQSGTIGSKNLSRLLGYTGDFAKFLGKQFEFMRYLVPVTQTGAQSVAASVLKKSDQGKRYGPTKKSTSRQSIGSAMSKTPIPYAAIIQDGKKLLPMTPQEAINGLLAYYKLIENEGDEIKKQFDMLPEFAVKDLEFRFAPTDVEIGTLWFDRGLTFRGTMILFGQAFGVNFNLGYTGLTLAGFMSTLDLGNIVRPGYKDQVVIDGAGPDGEYGTKDDGPAINLQMNLQSEPMFVLTGRVDIKPLKILEQAEVRINIKDGMKIMLKSKLFDLYNAQFTFNGPLVGSKREIGFSAVFEDKALLALQTKVLPLIKGMHTQETTPYESDASTAYKGVQLKIQQLKKEKAEIEAEIRKKEGAAWLQQTQTAVTKLKSAIAADQAKLKALKAPPAA